MWRDERERCVRRENVRERDVFGGLGEREREREREREMSLEGEMEGWRERTWGERDVRENVRERDVRGDVREMESEKRERV